MELLGEVCGPAERKKNGGLWRNRLREDPQKFQRVMEHVEHEKKRAALGQRKPIDTLGGFATTAWQTFTGATTAK